MMFKSGRRTAFDNRTPRRFAARITSALFVGSLSLVLVLAGCTPVQQGSVGGELSGTITISGAFALYPMVQRWGEEFQKLHPAVTFDISAGGAGKGMTDVLGGAVDLGMVSRSIRQEETDQGAFWVAVTRDAVVPTMNAQNPYLARIQAQGMSASTFGAIWTLKSTTWGEVLGDPSLVDEIHVYTRSDAAGAAETWAIYIGDLAQEDLQGIAVNGDPGLAEAVVQDPLGVGYNNLNYAYDADTHGPVAGLAIIPIDLNDDGQLSADEAFYATKSDLMAAIADGSYPSPPARGLNLVSKGKPTGLTLEFLRWVLTEGQAFTEETGFIPLTEAQTQAELEKLG
jgi:phosphate transport system substrate-binding protein